MTRMVFECDRRGRRPPPRRERLRRGRRRRGFVFEIDHRRDPLRRRLHRLRRRHEVLFSDGSSSSLSSLRSRARSSCLGGDVSLLRLGASEDLSLRGPREPSKTVPPLIWPQTPPNRPLLIRKP